ncbi:MAG: hypothetical protein Q8P39_00440 [Candidatus Yanofskybacteria bacterium]|nr:hypothetical protein [Candidatus Yanofskybacteria bacterium]
MKFGKYILGGVMVLGMYSPLQNAGIKAEFEKTYQRALYENADINNDGFISRVEQDEFDKKLLKGKQVSLVSGQMPRFDDGKLVSLETLTEWIREYESD